MKVLIADDSKPVRERLVSMIAGLNRDVFIRSAINGSDALEQLKVFQPDVVILDIRMPDKNGMQVLEEIRDKAQRPFIIMLSSYSYPQYHDSCRKLGANIFLDKSTEFEKIMQILETYET